MASAANVASDDSLTIPTSSRSFETEFPYFSQKVRHINRFKFPHFVGQVQALFNKQIHIEKQIGNLYYWKVIGNVHQYKKTRNIVIRAEAQNEAGIKILERTWKVEWYDIPFFGEFQLSNIDQFPTFYTARQLGFTPHKFRHFVAGANGIFHHSFGSESTMGQIYAAKFTGHFHRVHHIEKQLGHVRKAHANRVKHFKKRWGKDFNSLPFYGGETYNDKGFDNQL